MRASLAALVGALACGFASRSLAGAIEVDPILLEANAPNSAAVLRLKSSDSGAVTVQTRVLRWTQVNGVETLAPTADVVASPPAAQMGPNREYVVRIVRVAKTPLVGEESYRAIIDQLPSNPRTANPQVNLILRQSIPAFFRAPQLSPPNVAWSLKRRGGVMTVTATNTGDERLRVASLRLTDGSGASVSFGDGLVGYVLGRSTMFWELPPHSREFGVGRVRVSVKTNVGDLQAIAN